jgi:hypothetical protein
MSEVSHRSPKVTITWPLGKVSTDSVKLSAAINLHPLVEFTAFSGTEAAQASNAALSKDAAALMGQAQNLTHSARSAPDCSVSIDDGAEGSSLDFSGYLSGPNYRMNKGMIAPGFSMVAAATLMSNLKMDIYQVPWVVDASKESSLAQSSIAENVKEGNLSARLAKLTTETIAFWERQKAGSPDPPLSVAFKEKRHAANQNGPLAAWLELLSNSKDLDTPWLSKLGDNIDYNRKFNEEVLAILTGTSRDFLDVVLTLLGAFQLVMIPSKNGKPGKLVSMTSLLTEDPKDLALPASTIFLQGDNGSSLLPVQQIVVKGTPRPRYKLAPETTDAYSLTGGVSAIGAYPLDVETAAGDVEFVSLPFYLSHVISWATQETNEEGEGAPTLEQLKKSLGQMEDKVVQFQDNVVNKLISDYAKSLYVDRALGFTRTSIQVPLDVSLWPGTRYRVTNSNGDALFHGFLSGVQHSIDKKAMGGGGAPSTTLDFTHIEFPGFTLPGL